MIGKNPKIQIGKLETFDPSKNHADDALCCVPITVNSSASGVPSVTIAIVWLTTDFQFVIDFRDPIWQNDKKALDAVESAKALLTKHFDIDVQRPCSLSVFVKLDFADDTSTIVKYHAQHGNGARYGHLQTIMNGIRQAYVDSGYQVTNAELVSETAYNLFQAHTQDKNTYKTSWSEETGWARPELTHEAKQAQNLRIQAAQAAIREGRATKKLLAGMDLYALCANQAPRPDDDSQAETGAAQETLFRLAFESFTGVKFDDFLREELSGIDLPVNQ